MVFRQGGLLFKWNSANVVFAGVIYGLCNLRQCGFSPLTVVRVVCCPNIFFRVVFSGMDGLSSVWPFIRVVFRLNGPYLVWPFIRMVSHLDGLSISCLLSG